MYDTNTFNVTIVDILNRAPENTGEEKTPLEVIQLERHNDRLKEALMRLRDATQEQEAELNRKIKALEKENYELEDYKGNIMHMLLIFIVC